MLLEDLHTHTLYSHGKGTVEQTVRAAIARGLPRVGISEHGPAHLFFPVKWDALLRLRREIDRMQEKYAGQVEILMGLEANLLGDGKTDVPADTSIFDYLMLGFHKGTFPCDSISRKWWRGLLLPKGRRYEKENAMAYVHAMDSIPKLINITHPGTYIHVDIPLLAEEAAARGITLEINESHSNMNVSDIQAACAAGAQLYVSSDAHSPARVGEVRKSVALARLANALHRVKNWRE